LEEVGGGWRRLEEVEDLEELEELGALGELERRPSH
jgi:hypothetical protein